MEEQRVHNRSLWVDISTVASWRGNVTGIARTLNQLLFHWQADSRIPLRLCRFDPVRHVYHGVDLLHLRPARTVGKSAEAPPAPVAYAPRWPSSFQDPWPGDVREACWHLGQAAKCVGRLGRAVFRRVLVTGRRTVARVNKSIPGVQFAPGDVLFLGGASWKDSPPPSVLQTLRQSHGVRVANVVYDITPLRCPHLCAPDLTRAVARWLPGVLASSDLILTISDYSRRDLEAYGLQQGFDLPPIAKIRLGDEPGEDDGEQAPAELVARTPGPFVLSVSTIGLNKNQQMLFQIWRRLIDRHGGGVPTLVLVGQPGWRAELILRELRTDPVLGRHICYLPRINDRQLRWLYRRCLFTMYPSHYEGWGLPVAESLVYGKYCITSNAASLPEVGGNLVDYHDPLDGPSCMALIEKALLEPGWLASREERIRRDYQQTTWQECATRTFEILDQMLHLLPNVPSREAA